ncbi:MAG TPA: TetR/AcrR family transcriptional regulator C-terminal domain-containing protein [Pseudonocardia sp.]|nr:TetR/AcrR family transcriptional regulator C-terminal domain-containing protein [Pseudonocardia sp.]
MPQSAEAPRGALSRERIVRAAVELIERDGSDAVSMRRVAAALGVGTMSLYNHVPNKAALLDGVAEFIMADMAFAADPDAAWQDQARALARTFRGISLRYPRSVLVVTTRQPRSTVGLRPVEITLAALRAAGFDDRTAVRLMRTFVSFVLGSLVHRVGVAEAGAAGLAAAEGAELVRAIEEAGFRHVRDLLPVLAEHDHDGDFEFGLELLIGAMEALRRGG